MAKLGEERLRVVLVACPLEGHATPMLQLGDALHSRGHSITVAHTEFNFPNPMNHPDFNFVKLRDNMSLSDFSFFNLIGCISAMNNNCKDSLHNHLTQMVENQEQDGLVSCVIYDPVMYFTDAVANDLKIPSLIFRPSSAAYLKATRVNLQLYAEKSGTFPESCRLELVPDLEPLRYMDLPLPLYDVRIPEILCQLETNLSEIRSALAVICNTVQELEESDLAELKRHHQVPFFAIGPLHKLVRPSPSILTDEDKDCIAWLDRQAPKSVVYISLGSLALLNSKDLVEMAWGLANSGQPFLWVVRPGSIQGSKWIENLPEDFQEKVGQKGLVVKWAPQKVVLSHFAVGLFMSHCGWNSTMESISEGVPMVCRPCFGDQRLNARLLSHVWKLGLPLENSLDRGTIEECIRRVMVEDEGTALRQNALNLKAKLENCVEEGGSSCKSLDGLAKFIAELKS